MIGVISDVHSNLEALKAVLGELEEVDAILCAGDIVGYGPSPNECCELMRERGIQCVQGNHDFVCANLDQLDKPDGSIPEEDQQLCQQLFDQKNSAAQAASRWTSAALTDENRAFLRNLPVQMNEHGLTLVHGRPGSKVDMLNEYILPRYATAKLVENIEGHILVVGHSHLPMRTTRVINPGSVGQPRDRNWRASFATFKDVWYRFTYIKDTDLSFRIVNSVVSIRRIPYDVRMTIQKIKDLPELPDSLGDRLTVGL